MKYVVSAPHWTAIVIGSIVIYSGLYIGVVAVAYKVVQEVVYEATLDLGYETGRSISSHPMYIATVEVILPTMVVLAGIPLVLNFWTSKYFSNFGKLTNIATK